MRITLLYLRITNSAGVNNSLMRHLIVHTERGMLNAVPWTSRGICSFVDQHWVILRCKYQGLHFKQCSGAPETARKLTGQLDIQPGWTSNWQWIHFWYCLCFGDYLQIALCIGSLQIVTRTSVSIGCKDAIYNDSFIINWNHGFTHLISL